MAADLEGIYRCPRVSPGSPAPPGWDGGPPPPSTLACPDSGTPLLSGRRPPGTTLGTKGDAPAAARGVCVWGGGDRGL